MRRPCQGPRRRSRPNARPHGACDRCRRAPPGRSFIAAASASIKGTALLWEPAGVSGGGTPSSLSPPSNAVPRSSPRTRGARGRCQDQGQTLLRPGARALQTPKGHPMDRKRTAPRTCRDVRTPTKPHTRGARVTPPSPSPRTRGRTALRPGRALTAIGLFACAWLGCRRQTIAVFSALLRLADVRVLASPSAGPVDADQQSRRLLSARRRSARLDVLDASTGSASLPQRCDLGVPTIDLHAIAGTLEPAKARQLRPGPAWADRWRPLWLPYRHGDPVAPEPVYRIDGRYWLCDGYHRASVRPHKGARTIGARVTELR